MANENNTERPGCFLAGGFIGWGTRYLAGAREALTNNHYESGGYDIEAYKEANRRLSVDGDPELLEDAKELAEVWATGYKA